MRGCFHELRGKEAAIRRVEMKKTGLTTLKMLGVVAMAASLVSVWPGCKGSSPNGTGTGSDVGSVGTHGSGVVSALTASAGATAREAMTNPITSPFWQRIPKLNVGTQSHYAPAATATKIAAAYGKNSLYVAVINTGRDPWYNPSGAPNAIWRHDCVEVWLDTSRRQNGTNFYEIAIAPNGQVNQVWHRSSTPPMPTRDGQINFLQPYSLIPWHAKGLQTKASRSLYDGQPSWNVVVRIPLTSLPHPLRVTPHGGARLRANIIRYVWRARPDHSRRRLVQYNLFPVAKEAQAMAPYSMGRLILSPHAESDLTLAPSSRK